ncbi:MAG: VWA domain-containing protein [Elusimicrobiota bacterium]|jgi:Ca-activated chloride channel family protein|nr:VWA domain-containing protein [Elusimicrobiota bacterium]
MELFANNKVFFYLIITALIIALAWFLGQKRKRKILALLFNKANYLQLLGPYIKNRKKLVDILFLTGLFFLFIALAGPQWGRDKTIFNANYSQSVVALDTSASMLAEDIKPNRIESAKMMLSMLFENMTNERLGVIAFTSIAQLQAPITTDMDALKTLTAAITTNTLPVQGTALAPAVNLSARMLGSYGGKKALVLITDGEDHSPQDIQAALKTARDNDIKIITIGIGSIEGELIPLETPQGKTYKKDRDGKTVLTKLDENTLKSIASATGGVYIKYTTPQQVADEITLQLNALDKSTAQSLGRTGYKNRYQIPLFIAFILILCSILIPLRKVK